MSEKKFTIKGIVDQKIMYLDEETAYHVVCEFDRSTNLGYFRRNQFKCETSYSVIPGDIVLLEANCTAEDNIDYFLEFVNEKCVWIPKKYLGYIYEGKRVSVKFKIIGFTDFVPLQIEDLREGRRFVVRIPGTDETTLIAPIGKIENEWITCYGKVAKIFDDGTVDVDFDDLCVSLRLNQKYLKKES